MYCYNENIKKNPYRKKVYHEINPENMGRTLCGRKLSMSWVNAYYYSDLSYFSDGFLCKRCASVKIANRKKYIFWRFWYWLIGK